MELNTISLNDFVRNATIIFLKAMDNMLSPMRSSGLFQVEQIPQNSGNVRDFTEIDLNEYSSIKGQSDQAARAKVQQGYTKTATAYRIAADIGISYEMRTQNKYQEVVSRLTNLADQAVKKMDLDMSHRIGFGTATTYVNADGITVDISMGDTLSLFSTVHTVRGSGVTYRNRLANNPQFSRGALEAMEKLVVEETINQFGEKKAVTFDLLWSTDDPNTLNTIREVMKSTASVNGINAGITNVYEGKYRTAVLPRIATTALGLVDSTKSKYWGLASTMMSSAYLGVLEEPRLKTPAAGNNGEEFSTDDWSFGVRAGWFITIVSGAWIKGSTGDGTA